MDSTILNRAVFLIERADVPRAIPSQNQATELFASVAAVAAELTLCRHHLHWGKFLNYPAGSPI